MVVNYSKPFWNNEVEDCKEDDEAGNEEVEWKAGDHSQGCDHDNHPHYDHDTHIAPLLKDVVLHR